MAKKTEDIMRDALATHIDRQRTYNSGHRRQGAALAALFPDGLTLKTPEDFAHFMLFDMVMVKVTRYADHFETGGHQDSARDLQVYAAMLEAEMSDDDQ